MIESAELNIYFANGQMTTLDLSPLQLKTIVLALGISFPDESSYRCISDKALPAIIEHLQKKIKFIPEG